MELTLEQFMDIMRGTYLGFSEPNELGGTDVT